MIGRVSQYKGLLSVLLLAACSGGGGGTEGNVTTVIVSRFAFVANLGATSAGGELSAFTVNASTGQLRHNGYVVTATGGGLTSVAVDPSSRFVYATNSSGVWGFSISAATGALTPIAGSPFSDGGGNPAAIAIDPLGRFAFVANGGGGVSAYKFSATTPGALTPAGQIAAGGVPNSLAVDPSGRFVYVASQGSNGVSQYSINATTGALGTLTPSFVATAVAPLGIGIDPSGRSVYVVGAAATLNVLGFNIGANGTLSPFLSGPVSAGNNPRAITFDAGGRFAYVANQTSADVTVFQVAANGVLSSPVAAATQSSQTWTAALDPSGQFAYAVNQGTGDITLFSVNAGNGSLSRQGSVAGRFSPGSIAFTRGTSAITYVPRFAFTANLGSNDVSAFRIDAASGALSLTGAPIASGGALPFPVAADPTGQFLYVGHENTSNVTGFRIDATTGALTQIGTPQATGAGQADGLTVDPSGRFVYAGNVGNNVSGLGHTVSPAAITAGTGVLGAFGTPVDTIGLQPFSPAVDPSGRFLYTANFASTSVSAFLINAATGGISAIAGQPFAQANAQSPFSLAVSPSGRFVYVANRIDPNDLTFTNGNVSVFQINLGTGALSELTGGASPVPAGAGPRSIAVHPSGRFVYVANENDSTVTAYQADPSTGVLTPVTGSPFHVGGAMRPLTVDPSGRFLYAAQTGAAKVSAFTIDPDTGVLGPVVGITLTPIGGAPVPTGTNGSNGLSPFTITTTGTIQ